MPEERNQAERSRPTRLALFANFFKGYMSVATIVAAAIPIPITSWKLIPIYSQQRGFLTVYSSLFCFLLMAFVFSIRHWLARPMFSRGRMGGVIAVLPAVFIVLTLGCIVIYHGLMQQSIKEVHELGVVLTTTELLDKVDVTEIPYAVELAACYLGIFIFAELAFVLMAMREYLQDLLHLDEVALLRGRALVADAPVEARVSSVAESSPVSR